MYGTERDGTILREKWEIRFRDGSLPIRGDLRTLQGFQPDLAVVICHGFKGFREWGFFPSLARALARRGYAAVTFDFTRNGVGDDGVDFSALDRFSENTHSRNLDEIGQVIDAVLSGELLSPPPARLARLGHSRGGGEAILKAAEDRRVDALVTWSAIEPSRASTTTDDAMRIDSSTSCVTNSTVVSVRCHKSTTRSCICTRVWASKAPNGSSSNSILG